MIKHAVEVIKLLLLSALITASGVAAQPSEIRTDADLETLLADSANLTIDVPELGYFWSNSSFTGSADSGTISVTSTKVIYYFLHWGPIEVTEVTEDYVRERIPKIWPDEGLQVLSVSDTIIAGHPAYFAEVMPKRDFYRAFFLIWNCPESGRQFIADMNYNVQYRTPRAELETEFETTYHTLACHPGAETKELPDHVLRYTSRRFGISFDHPLHWFVIENPYAVPHPEYRGIRNKEIGSLLAHLQDMTTDAFFKWEILPDKPADDTKMMGSRIEHYRAGLTLISTMDLVESFQYDDAETIIVNGRTVFKLFGDAVRVTPENPPPDFASSARAMLVLVDDLPSKRRLQVVILIDEYEVDGVFKKPVRDIFDRWATAIAEGVTF